jgi:Type IV secretory system Conjugative DNA transfer
VNIHQAMETAALGAVPAAAGVGLLRQRLGGHAGGPTPGHSRSPSTGSSVGSLAASRRGRQPARGWAGRPAAGIDDGSRWATRRDLRALGCAGPAAGRIVLGTAWGRRPRRLLAAEAAQSVAVVGPTQSGKTTALAVPAILGWDGPVLAASVKTDLVRDTLAWRRRCGTVWCFDPAGTTGLPPSRWSPLGGAASWQGARRVAADLTEVTRSDATTADGEFWYATAAKLLAPLLFAAAASGRTMGDVVRWVDTQETEEVLDVLHAAGVPEAIQAVRATWLRDERQRSAIYTTAETVVEPFAEPASVANGGSSAMALTHGPSGRATDDRTPPFGTPPVRRGSGTGTADGAPLTGAGAPVGGDVDPERLLTGRHTLYLCAPAHDQRRLRGLFVALVQQVLHAAFATAARAGRPLDPPLLVVLDEAANIAPLRDLDGLAAACPLRRAGRHRGEQPPRQGLPPRHRRPGHPGLRQPAGRGARAPDAVGDLRGAGRAHRHVRTRSSPPAPAGRSPADGPGHRRPPLRLLAAGPPPAPALVRGLRARRARRS